MTRIAPKKDDNQTEIVELVRALGGDWIQTFRLGKGAPDAVFGVHGFTIVTGENRVGGALVAGSTEPIINDILVVLKKYGYVNSTVYWGANIAVEIKDGSKPPSARKLTEDEQAWHDSWPGQVCIWESDEDVLRGLGRKVGK